MPLFTKYIQEDLFKVNSVPNAPKALDSLQHYLSDSISFPYLLCLYHTGLVARPQAHTASSPQLQCFALAVPSARNALPQVPCTSVFFL